MLCQFDSIVLNVNRIEGHAMSLVTELSRELCRSILLTIQC